MTGHPAPDELMAWRDGEVAEPRSAEIAAHVAQCAACAAVAGELAALSARLSEWRVEAPPPTGAGRAAVAGTPGRAPVAPARRRMLVWAAAAVLLIGVVATVRVDCSPAPTCDLRTMHFAFLPRDTRAATAAVAQGGSLTPQQAFERDWLSRRRLPVPVPPNSKAIVNVVMFIDWQCPACRAAERAYGVVFADFERRRPGAVRVEIKDYPLNMRCNPHVPVELHPAACDAAVGVRLAREQGTAPALIEWLFANQETLTPASVRQAAATVGKVTDFARRYDAVLKDVARDIADARALEVGGTPTCFINGILARNNGGQTLFSPDEIRRAIEVELLRAR